MLQSLRQKSRSISSQPHTVVSEEWKGEVFTAGGSQFEQWLPGVQCLILGFCSSFLLSSPLGVQWVLPACPYSDIPIRKPPAESSVWQVIHSAVVLETWIVSPEILGWPRGPPTYIIPLAEEDKEAEKDLQAAHRREWEQKQTETLSPPSTASSPAQVHLSWWKVIESHTEDTLLCHLCVLALN